MVYGGAPSKGCSTCRERKIGCDQLPDGCSQCLRAQRQCPGYRDQLDLVFVNQSQQIARKVESKAAIRLKQQAERANARTRSESPKRPTRLSRYALAPTHDDRATSFFFSNYVIGASGPTEGHFDVLTKVGFEVDEHLLRSIKAVGLAGFSGVASAPELMRDARLQYLEAIRLVNEALSSPAEAKKDSTLCTTLILGMFEKVAGSGTDSVAAWANHVAGAAALLKLRGLEQFSSSDGRRMFVQVTSSLLTWSIQAEIALPEHILQFRSLTAMQSEYSREHAWLFLESMLPFTQFRAGVRSGEITDPDIIFSRALQLDEEFIAIFSHLPEQWKYQNYYTNEDPDEVFAGHYHVYNDFSTCRIWNAMRGSRILLHGMIHEILLKSLPSTVLPGWGPAHSAMLQNSARTMAQLQADILASVPEHMGYVDKLPRFSPGPAARDTSILVEGSDERHDTPSGSDEVDSLVAFRSPYQTVQAFRGQILTWPLFIAGSAEITTDATRLWIVNKLRSLARSMGIRQGLTLADILERKDGKPQLFNPATTRGGEDASAEDFEQIQETMVTDLRKVTNTEEL